MKIYILLFISILLITDCLSQETLSKEIFAIKQEVNAYIINGKQIKFYTYEIHNEGNDDLWLWFEKNEISTLSNKKAVKKYFYQRGVDVSLYQIAMETNIEEMTSEIFSTFLKKIVPQERFTVQIISDYNSEKKDSVIYTLDKHIRIITESELLEYIPNANSMNSRIFYKHNSVPLLFGSFYM